MIEVGRCPVCGSGQLRVVKTYVFERPHVAEHDSRTGGISYRHERLNVFFDHIWKGGDTARIHIDMCGSCGLLFENPRFTASEIATKYAVVGALESARERVRMLPPLRTDERAKRIHRLVSDVLGEPPRSRRILDYGDAEGYNLVPFVPDNRCFVLDYVRWEHPEGVAYLGEDVSSLSAGDRFDVILLSHVLEHAIDPVSMTGELMPFLSDDGVMYAEVPLGVFREWRLLAEPLTHVNFFSEQSACKCLQEAGLTVRHVSTRYQWVLRDRSWCVNIVGRKAAPDPAGAPRYRATSSQMRNPAYYVRPSINKARKTFSKALSRRT